ncbi:MAG: zinc ribbon domain-containing protein [Promethearchaeota archaeon]
MEKIGSIIELTAGESIIGFYKTKKSFFGLTGEGEEGYLVLTNYKLLFYKGKGLISKSYVLTRSDYLVNLSDISVGGIIFRHISINGIKYFLDGRDPQALRKLLRNAVQEAKGGPYDPVSSIKERVQEIVRSIPLISLITQQSHEFIYCTACAYKNNADAIFCKNCGAKIEKE